MRNIMRISVCFMVCFMILAVCDSINNVSAYELVATVNGKVMKIDAKGANYEWRQNIRGKSLKIIGTVSRDDFMSIGFISSECEMIDLSDLKVEVIPYQSFIENEKLKKVILPKHLKKIENCCFSGCYFLETVVLPDSLKEIDYGSFQCCPRLNMRVSSNVKFDDSVFYGSPGVTIVEAESNVPLCGFCSWLLDWMKLGGKCDKKKDA